MGLGARLAIFFAAVAATTALLVGGASYITTDRQVIAEVDDFLKQRAEEISDGRRDQPRNRGDGRSDNDTPDDGQVIVAVSPDAEVQVLDRGGEVLSNTGLLLPVDQADRKLTEDDGPARLRTVTIDDTEYRMITEHLPGDGAVQVARSLEESSSLLGVLQTRIVLVAGMVALLAAAAGWVVAQRTTRPLRALTNAVDEVAETRDFSVPVPTSGRDEIGRLGRGFNRMLATLHVSQEQQHRLVQDAAHELRTPLTSMTANVEWLLRAPDIDAETRSQTLAGIRRELGELNDVMAEVIELATDSHRPSEFEPVDLADVARTAVARFVRRSGRDVTIEAQPTPVLGDADALARALTNLLGNAHKYSPDGSPIAVGVTPSGVFVDDEGPGIPPAERAAVFERFYRRDEDRSKPGSGLGLSIVAGIVEQHGGRCSIGDSPQGGTRIGFSLPPAPNDR